MHRQIKQILKGEVVTEGAGVKLRRVFGYMENPNFDPFLMLDDFRAETSQDYIKGFPWHPHRGIETITYVLKGDVEHGDSLGNKGVISSGDVQWMTAAGGIIHQEMPKGDANGAMHGFQLWANLPAKDKMMPPRYRGIAAEKIPEVVAENGSRIKIIAGKRGDVSGPVDGLVIDPEFMDCIVPAGREFIHPTKRGHTAFIYVIGGSGRVNGADVDNRTLVLFDDGDEFAITAGNAPVRFLMLTGKPLGEPVAWRGPIVMNTADELDLAFREYREGTFVKQSAPMA